MRPKRRHGPADPHDPTTWLNRTEVGRQIKLSHDGVRYLETNGTFHPRFVEGMWRFDPLEIDRYVKARAAKLINHEQNADYTRGEIAAHAFSLFGKGCTRREVVLKLKIEPDYAQRLWEQYQPETFEQAAAIKATQEEDANREHQRVERAKQLKTMLEQLGNKGTK
jgi:hypothetical protein